MNRETILLEDGLLRLHTSNDVISIGSETDYVNTASMVVTGTNNVTIDNIEFPREVGLYNGYSSYKHPSASWYLFYTGDFWALNNGSKTDNFEDCLFTCPNQIGIYKANYGVTGNSTEVHVSRTGDQEGLAVTSNGLFDATYLTTNYLTLNQSRIFFDSTSNSNRLNALDTLDIAVLFQTNNDNTFAVPTGCVDDWAIQTFTTVLVGTDSTNVSDTSFDDTFVTDESLGVTEWIYTSNFRTDGNHYTDNLVDDDSLEIAGIEHNAALGVQVNTPDTVPGTGNDGQVVFAANERRTSLYYNSWVHVTGKPYPEFPDWRQLGNMYGSYMDALDEHKDYYVSKRTESLSVETVNLTTNISSPTGTNPKLNLPDGGIVFTGYQTDDWLFIYPDGEDKTINIGQSVVDPCLSPVSNKVYLPPFSSVSIRELDIDTSTLSITVNVDGANHTNFYTQGSVVADDGTIHFIHSDNEDEVIKLTLPNTVTYYGTGCSSTNQTRNFQPQVNHDGILYAIPGRHRNGKWYMRKVDPVAETVTDIELGNTTSGSVHSIAVPYKNYILFPFPDSSGDYRLGKFDTTDNSMTTVSDTVYNFSGGINKMFLGPDGCVYFSSGGSDLIRADIEANTTTKILDGTFERDMAISSSGYAYAFNSNAGVDVSQIKKVKLFDVPIDPNFLCNRYLNTT